LTTVALPTAVMSAARALKESRAAAMATGRPIERLSIMRNSGCPPSRIGQFLLDPELMLKAYTRP
jgi:hypothetical protein